MAKYITLLCVLGLMATRINAQDDMMASDTSAPKIMWDHIRADRPYQSGTAFLVPKGSFQMEHGFSIEDTDPGFIYSYPSSLWKYGVNENFEIRLATHYITIQHEPNPDVNGFLPLSLGLKAKLTDQHGALPKISLIGQMSFPGLVSEDFETTYFGPSLHLAFYNHVSDFFSVSYNAGAEWNGETAEPNFTYSLAPAINLTDRIGLYGEIYGKTPQRYSGDLTFRADAGITFLVTNDLLLDVSAGTGLTDDAPEQYVAFGISYRFHL